MQITPDLSDGALVALSRNGNQKAFGELTRRHWVRCLNVGCFYLHNRFDAEDCVQTAFLKAYEHLDQFQGDSLFPAWLGRIVTNECLALMRVRRRVRFVYIDAPSETTTEPYELADIGADPEGDLGYSELIKVLRDELMLMPPLFRGVLLLRYIRGLLIHEVAQELSITVEAAKSRLVRARADLRERMIERMAPNSDSRAGGRPTSSGDRQTDPELFLQQRDRRATRYGHPRGGIAGSSERPLFLSARQH